MMDDNSDLPWLDLKLEFDRSGVLQNGLLLKDGEPVGRLSCLMNAKFESEAQKCGTWTLGLDALHVRVEHQTDDES